MQPLSVSVGCSGNNEERVVPFGVGLPGEFGRLRETIWRMGNGEAKAEAQDLRLSPQSGGGKSEVAERRVTAQRACSLLGGPWGLGLDGG